MPQVFICVEKPRGKSIKEPKLNLLSIFLLSHIWEHKHDHFYTWTQNTIDSLFRTSNSLSFTMFSFTFIPGQMFSLWRSIWGPWDWTSSKVSRKVLTYLELCNHEQTIQLLQTSVWNKIWVIVIFIHSIFGGI